MHPAILLVLGINYVVAFAGIGHLLLSRKEPQAKVLWLGLLLLVPLGGVTLYWLFGVPHFHKRRRVKKLQADRHIRSELRAYHARTAASPEGLTTVGGVTDASLVERGLSLSKRPILGGNALAIHEDGKALDAMLGAIEGAEHCVHIEFYEIADDADGRAFRDALARKAARGCCVRVLYDEIGSYWTPWSFFAPLVRAGGEVAGFVPLNPLRGRFQLNFRNHRKILVIDGHLAFTGGMNIGAMYRGRGLEPPSWRDLGLEVRGPAVRELQKVFTEDWHFATGRKAIDPHAFPPISPVGPHAVQVVSGGPDDRAGAIEDLIFTAFANARRSLVACTPYFAPVPGVLAALRTAALRGVRVRLILPRFVDHRIIGHANRSFYEPLLEAGAEIWELDGAYLHAKYAAVDGEWCTVGSANIDARSFFMNFETNVVVFGEFARAIEAVADRDIARSRRITLAEVRRWPLYRRLVQGACGLLAPIL